MGTADILWKRHRTPGKVETWISDCKKRTQITCKKPALHPQTICNKQPAIKSLCDSIFVPSYRRIFVPTNLFSSSVQRVHCVIRDVVSLEIPVRKDNYVISFPY